jgi:hypothetical protein
MSRLLFFAFSIALFSASLFNASCKTKEKGPDPAELAKRQQFTAPYGSPTIDGNGADEAWQQSEWLPLDQLWIGKAPTPADFTGRYKLAWDESNLYLLAEITDDTLIDIHPDGLEHFWDDDCLEVFVDEDAAGGDHQYNYSAFAYHIALDGKVVDTRPNHHAGYFNDHCISRRITDGNTSVWEVVIKLFDKNYEEEGENIPKMLSAGKKIGFALAYCDNDHSAERENFMGNVVVEGEDKNQGWKNASIFGVVEMVGL